MKKWIILVAVFTLAHFTNAADPIVEGYGKTLWGQSLEEVQKIFPVGTVHDDPALDGQYAVKHDNGPKTQTIYYFVGDQLYRVYNTFDLPGRPDQGEDKAGFEIIKEKIAEKYHKTAEAKKALESAGIRINVSPAEDGRITVSYVSYETYEAGTVIMKAERKARAAAELKQLLEGKRQQQINDTGIDDLL